MFRFFYISLTLLLFSSFAQLQGNNCYSEYWQNLYWKMWENESFALATFARIDSGDHLNNIRSIQLNEQFIWKKSQTLTLEIHYAYVHDRSIVPKSPWRWQHRIELEANPLFLLPNCLIRTRNRLEIRRVQKEPKTLYRLRQRTMLTVPFENRGIFKAYSVYNEIFYNIFTHLFTQDRLCPCQLTFAVSDKIDLDVFFLIRFFRTDDIWEKSAVFGTQFNF